MREAKGPVLPAPSSHPCRSPGGGNRVWPMAASVGRVPENILTMRPLVGSSDEMYDRGPGTPDVVLHNMWRNKHRSGSMLSFTSDKSDPDSARWSGETAQDHYQEQCSHRWRQPTPDRCLAMPSAQRSSLLILNDSSPPLSPVHSEPSSDVESDSRRGSPSVMFAYGRTAYGTPRHAWSAAQANADAAAADAETRSWNAAHARLDMLSKERTSPQSSFESAMSEDGPVPVSPDHAVWLKRAYQYGMSFFRNRSCARADRDSAQATFTWSALAPHAWKMVLLGITFVVATALLGLCLGSLPLHVPKHLAQLTLTEIRDVCAQLREYARHDERAMVHVFFVLSALFTWKQAFCVPGSLIMNIVFGAMYGSYLGCAFASVLTALGGVLCYLLAAPFSEVMALLPGIAKPLNSMRKVLQSMQHAGEMSRATGRHGSTKSQNLWSYLLFLRLLPIVPYGVMNIVCGVLQVPLVPYAVTMGIGSMPWNFCTAQIGDILQDVVSAIQKSASMAASTQGEANRLAAGQANVLASGALTALVDRLWTADMIVKLVLLSVASALPIVLQRFWGHRRDSDVVIEEDALKTLSGRV